MSSLADIERNRGRGIELDSMKMLENVLEVLFVKDLIKFPVDLARYQETIIKLKAYLFFKVIF